MDRAIPVTYLLWTGLYSFLFAVTALVLSLTLFDDRDLA